MSIITFQNNIYSKINNLVTKQQFSSVVVLVDSNTYKFCLPYFKKQVDFEFTTICIEAGETYKNLDTVKYIWNVLISYNIDRYSLMINLGGGVITDMGGFVALTYKRGISFINIPTTLLGMVDAAIGGKTGVDFNGLKNQIGIIASANLIGIDSSYLKTLPEKELHSGMGEVFKYGLINDTTLWKKLVSQTNIKPSDTIIESCVKIKNEIVSRDLTEKGERKILNFGHTLGHAIESYFLTKPLNQQLLHGEAVAIGMVMATYLSQLKTGLSVETVYKIQTVINQHFTLPLFTNQDMIAIKDLLKYDKKNHGNHIRFVLLEEIGKAVWDVNVDINEIDYAFDQYATL